MKKKVLTNYRPPEAACAPYLDRMEFVMPAPEQMSFSRAQMRQLIVDADALWGVSFQVDREMIDAGSKLQAIGTLAVGYDNIDWQYAAQKGIPVINTPNAVTESTAELAVSLMLAVMRDIARLDAKLRREGRLTFSYYDSTSSKVFGKTVGVIGFGRIGKAFARKASGLGMNVVYYDPIRAETEVERNIGASYLPLADLLHQADVVSLHLPQTPDTVHMMNAERFAMMKPTAYFINAARGGMVNEADLAQALATGVIKGAGLDVFEQEPLIHPALLQLENVVLTAHVGTWTTDTRLEMAWEVLTGMDAVFRGRMPDNAINRHLL